MPDEQKAEGLLSSPQKLSTLMVQFSELWKTNELGVPTAARGSEEQLTCLANLGTPKRCEA